VTFEDLFRAIPLGAYRVDPKLPVVANASPDGILVGHPSFTITIRTAQDDFAPFYLMHEITHGAAKEGGKNYTHIEMVNAAWAVGSRMSVIYNMENFGLKDATPNPNEDLAATLEEKRRINNTNSLLFNAIVIRACRDSK
jgi:hypothetical protein